MDFTAQLRFLSDRISVLGKATQVPYIHCSKLNSIIMAFSKVKSIIDSKHHIPPKNNRAIKNGIEKIIQIIEDIQHLRGNCLQEVCAHFAVSSSLKGVYQEILSMRKDAAKALEAMNLSEAAKCMAIPEAELLSQNLVDSRRIALLLNQVGKRGAVARLPEVKKQIEKRRKSLGHWKVDILEEEHESIGISQIQASLELLMKFDDLIFGQQIGVGQSGRVVRGMIKTKNMAVAIKILRSKVLNEFELEMFRREVFTMSVLQHPNLLNLLGYTLDSPYCVVMPYMKNGSLSDFMAKHGNELNATDRKLIALDVAHGMEFLHSRGVIHRDLKAHNVMLDNQKRARIGDFGLARVKTTSDPMTGLVGTSYYMAPEVLRSSPFYDERIDVYSFGMVLWQLLTNQELYAGENKGTVVLEIMQNQRRPVIPDGTAPEISTLIEKCWSEESSDRPFFPEIIAKLEDPKFQFPERQDAVLENNTDTVSTYRCRSNSAPHVSMAEPLHKRSNSVVRVAAENNKPVLLLQKLEKVVCGSNVEVNSNLNNLIDEFKATISGPNVNWLYIVPSFVDLMNVANSRCRTKLVHVLFDMIEQPDAFDFLDPRVIPDLLQAEDENVVNTALGCMIAKQFGFYTSETIDALLTFPDKDNQMMRISAMMIILDYVKKSGTVTLEIVHGLLDFAKKPVPTKSLVTLLSRLKVFLREMKGVDMSTVSRLAALVKIIPTTCADDLVNCIKLVVSHPNIDSRAVLPIISNAFEKYESYSALFSDFMGFCPPYYQELAHMLAKLSGHTTALKQLVRLNAKYKEFRAATRDQLPVKATGSLVVSLYEHVIDDREQSQQVLSIAQFYQVAADLVDGPNADNVVYLLRLDIINTEHFIRYTSGPLVAKVLERPDTPDIAFDLRIAAIVYSVSAICEVPKFRQLIPYLQSRMESSNAQVAQASYLACCLLMRYFPFQTYLNTMLLKSAYYVNHGGSHAQNAANFVVMNYCEAIHAPTVARKFVMEFTELSHTNRMFAGKLVSLLGDDSHNREVVLHLKKLCTSVV